MLDLAMFSGFRTMNFSKPLLTLRNRAFRQFLRIEFQPRRSLHIYDIFWQQQRFKVFGRSFWSTLA